MDLGRDIPEFDYEDEEYTILKGRFKAMETNTYGLFIIFFSSHIRNIENLIAIASHYSSIFDVDPHLPWYNFEETIINTKWKGDIAIGITLDLQNYMESSLVHERGNELYVLIKNNDEPRIESLLQSILMKPLGDRNIFIEIAYEFVLKSEMDMTREEHAKSTKSPLPKTELKSIPETYKGKELVELDLILAPVSGIPINELKVGDKIMVRINEKSPKGKYYIDLLGAKVDGNVIPLPAEVEKIERTEKKEYVLICKLEKGFYGRAIESEQVKLKKYDELFSRVEKSQPEITILEGKTKIGGFLLFSIVMGGLIFILLLVVLLLWFYNFI